MPARIEGLLEELMNDVKVIPERRRRDLAKVFDEDVEKGADKREGIKWVDLRYKAGMSAYTRSEA